MDSIISWAGCPDSINNGRKQEAKRVPVTPSLLLDSLNGNQHPHIPATTTERHSHYHGGLYPQAMSQNQSSLLVPTTVCYSITWQVKQLIQRAKWKPQRKPRRAQPHHEWAYSSKSPYSIGQRQITQGKKVQGCSGQASLSSSSETAHHSRHAHKYVCRCKCEQNTWVFFSLEKCK